VSYAATHAVVETKQLNSSAGQTQLACATHLRSSETVSQLWFSVTVSRICECFCRYWVAERIRVVYFQGRRAV